jgi:hypothetical protein
MGNWQIHKIPGEAKCALLECGGRLLGTKTARLETWEMATRRMSRNISLDFCEAAKMSQKLIERTLRRNIVECDFYVSS